MRECGSAGMRKSYQPIQPRSRRQVILTIHPPIHAIGRGSGYAAPFTTASRSQSIHALGHSLTANLTGHTRSGIVCATLVAGETPLSCGNMTSLRGHDASPSRPLWLMMRRCLDLYRGRHTCAPPAAYSTCQPSKVSLPAIKCICTAKHP